MGGNTYNRKHFSDVEILELVNHATTQPLKGLFCNRIFDTENQWRSNVSRYLDNDSCIRFYFNLYSPAVCKSCQLLLSMVSFNASHRYKFNTYCPACVRNCAWTRFESEEQKKKRGTAITQSKLAFYQTDDGKKAAKLIGETNSAKLTEFYQTARGKENAKRSSELNRTLMNERILNGTFTPNSNNRNTHWDSMFNDKKYRSSWEALYQSFFPNDIHEELRIKYYHNNDTKIYIVDFINHNNKIVTEVKPKELCTGDKFNSKLVAVTEWCNNSGYQFRIADLQFLQALGRSKVDLTKFDEKTQKKIQKLFKTKE